LTFIVFKNRVGDTPYCLNVTARTQDLTDQII